MNILIINEFLRLAEIYFCSSFLTSKNFKKATIRPIKFETFVLILTNKSFYINNQRAFLTTFFRYSLYSPSLIYPFDGSVYEELEGSEFLEELWIYENQIPFTLHLAFSFSFTINDRFDKIRKVGQQKGRISGQNEKKLKLKCKKTE